MLWHLQHGATAKTYRDQCIERGVPVPAYLIPPEPLPGVEAWFSAFWELRTERRFAEGPIPASAIRSYPVAPNEADTFAEAMRAPGLAQRIQQRYRVTIAGPSTLHALLNSLQI